MEMPLEDIALLNKQRERQHVLKKLLGLTMCLKAVFAAQGMTSHALTIEAKPIKFDSGAYTSEAKAVMKKIEPLLERHNDLICQQYASKEERVRLLEGAIQVLLEAQRIISSTKLLTIALHIYIAILYIKKCNAYTDPVLQERCLDEANTQCVFALGREDQHLQTYALLASIYEKKSELAEDPCMKETYREWASNWVLSADVTKDSHVMPEQ